jgi:hypothetical protein
VNWLAAMRWARLRSRDTGKRYRVYGYLRGGRWAYAVTRSDWVPDRGPLLVDDGSRPTGPAGQLQPADEGDYEPHWGID